MTDEEIISIMYDHANGFSSCIQFADDASVIAFARAVLDQAPAKPPKPEFDLGHSYTERLESFTQSADAFLRVPEQLDD